MISSIYNGIQGAVEGAILGATIAGTTSVVGLTTYVIPVVLLETANRAIGNEPKWPMFEGDCQLQQFQGLSACKNPPVSFWFVASCLVCTTTVIGMIRRLANPVFQKSHQG